MNFVHAFVELWGKPMTKYVSSSILQEVTWQCSKRSTL